MAAQAGSEGHEELEGRKRMLMRTVHDRDEKQGRSDGEILRQQNGEGGASGGLIQAARLGEHAHHKAGGGHRQRRAHDERGRGVKLKPEGADRRESRRRGEHLREAEP